MLASFRHSVTPTPKAWDSVDSVDLHHSYFSEWPKPAGQGPSHEQPLHRSTDEDLAQPLFDLCSTAKTKSNAPAAQSFDFFDSELGIESWDSSCNEAALPSADAALPESRGAENRHPASPSWRRRSPSSPEIDAEMENRAVNRQDRWLEATAGTKPMADAVFSSPSKMKSMLLPGLRPQKVDNVTVDPHRFIRAAQDSLA